MVANNTPGSSGPERRRLAIPPVPRLEDPLMEAYAGKLRQVTMDEFNRLADEFHTLQQQVINSAGVTLAAVSAVTVTSVDENSASFSWVLPPNNPLPNFVRVRIAEFGDTWAEFTYPTTTFDVNALAPSTEYTLQIQLLYRGEEQVSFVNAVRNCPSTPVVVESTSEIRSLSFTTDTGVGPPTDGGGGSTDFPIPEVPSGDPGTGGSGTDCHWEWTIQIASDTDGTWSDTAHTGTVNGDAGTINIDTTVSGLGLLSTRLYRLCIEEICDGASTGVTKCSNPFTGDHDWTDGCGGVPDSNSFSITPFSNANLFRLFDACLVDGGSSYFVQDNVSDTELLQGPAFLALINQSNEWAVLASDFATPDDVQQTGFMTLQTLLNLNNSDDFSIAVSVDMSELPATTSIRTFPLVSIGEGRIVISGRTNGTNWGWQLAAQLEAGGQAVFQTTMDISLNEYSEFIFAYDSSAGTVDAWVDKVQVIDTTVGTLHLDNMNGGLRIYSVANSWMKTLCGWDRALGAADIIVEGLVTHYDTKDAANRVTSGSTLTQLNDKGPNGFNMTPLDGSVFFNTSTEVVAVGSADPLDTSNSLAIGTDAFLVVGAIKLDGADTGAVFGMMTVASNNGEWGFYCPGTTTIQARIEVSGSTYHVTGTPTLNQWIIVTQVIDRNVGGLGINKLRIDGTQIGASSWLGDSGPINLPAGNGSTNNLGWGIANGPTQRRDNHRFGEFKVYKRTTNFSAGEIESIEAELALKWGVTLS